jgi:hypothetical protein
MRTSNVKIFLIFISFFVLVGIACLNSGTTDPTATVDIPIIPEEPTTEPIVIVEPSPTIEQPSATPTTKVEEPVQETEEAPPAYFTEEFEGNIDSWTYFLMNGDENKMDLYTDNGRLVFDLQGTYQYVYVLYDEYYYPEVRIDVVAENRGKNTNNVSLICNYSERDGWYEFNISNGGLYDILVYSEIDKAYFGLQSGGSTNINMGRAVNQYTAICEGNRLALYINGVLEKEVVDNKYNLKEGQVGVSVSSFDVIPILVEVDSFSISLP